jgi:hypothetical protein
LTVKCNWPHKPFTRWEREYIARRVLEHAGQRTVDLFGDYNPNYGYSIPRRPKKDMPVHYTIQYLDEFSSYIIGMGLKAHRAELRERILERMAKRKHAVD